MSIILPFNGWRPPICPLAINHFRSPSHPWVLFEPESDGSFPVERRTDGHATTTKISIGKLTMKWWNGFDVSKATMLQPNWINSIYGSLYHIFSPTTLKLLPSFVLPRAVLGFMFWPDLSVCIRLRKKIWKRILIFCWCFPRALYLFMYTIFLFVNS